MFQYPENIGYAFGGPGSPEYVLIELYYENSQGHSGMQVQCISSLVAQLLPIFETLGLPSLSACM